MITGGYLDGNALFFEIANGFGDVSANFLAEDNNAAGRREVGKARASAAASNGSPLEAKANTRLPLFASSSTDASNCAA